MHTQSKHTAPIHQRGGQSSYLLLAAGQFGTKNLVTWVDCPPASEQQLHQHDTQEQVYVIIRGRGTMIVGDEEQETDEGTLVVIPPRTQHAIRNSSDAARADATPSRAASAQPPMSTIPSAIGAATTPKATRRASSGLTLP